MPRRRRRRRGRCGGDTGCESCEKLVGSRGRASAWRGVRWWLDRRSGRGDGSGASAPLWYSILYPSSGPYCIPDQRNAPSRTLSAQGTERLDDPPSNIGRPPRPRPGAGEQASQVEEVEGGGPLLPVLGQRAAMIAIAPCESFDKRRRCSPPDQLPDVHEARSGIRDLPVQHEQLATFRPLQVRHLEVAMQQYARASQVARRVGR